MPPYSNFTCIEQRNEQWWDSLSDFPNGYGCWLHRRCRSCSNSNYDERELWMRKIIGWRKVIRPLGCIVFAAFLFQRETGSLLWFGFSLLGIWFIAVDVFSVGVRNVAEHSPMDSVAAPVGVLGTYLVDSSESYGMFIKLDGVMVFVDIRQDHLVRERERQAQDLFAHQGELEQNLIAFIGEHPEFKSKHISYIGLHSDEMTRGEVFWSPSGYTILREGRFVLV